MKTRKPAWWQLYLLVLIMFGLVALEALKPWPGIADTTIDAGIVALFFGAVFMWVHLNGGLLEHYYMERDGACDFKVTVYQPENDGNEEQAWSSDGIPNGGIPQYDWENIAIKEEERWSRN